MEEKKNVKKTTKKELNVEEKGKKVTAKKETKKKAVAPATKATTKKAVAAKSSSDSKTKKASTTKTVAKAENKEKSTKSATSKKNTVPAKNSKTDKTVTNTKKATTSKATTKKDENTKTNKEKNTPRTVKIVNTKSLRAEVEDILGENFENSSKAVRDTKNQASKVKSNNNESVKRANTTAKTKSSTASKTASKATTKRPGTSKAAGVKKRISEEVSKAVSEKSSKIKIKPKEKITKEDIEKITTESVEQIKKENEPEKISSISEMTLQEIDEEMYLRRSIPKDEFTKMLKKSSFSISYIVVFFLFLIFNNVAYYHMPSNNFINVLKTFAFVFLGVAIAFLEISYNKDDTKKCVIGIETLLMGIFTLSLPYMYQIYHGTYTNLLKSAGIVILGYCIVKACIVFYSNQAKYFRAQDDLVREDNDSEFNTDDDED